jgi:hypothetical protein
MRKILFIILLFAAGPLCAQSVKLSISAGLNEATANVGNTQSSINYLAGINAGIFAGIDFGNITVRPGLSYSQKGYTSKTSIIVPSPNGAIGTFNASGKIRLNYLELPLDVLYNIHTKPGNVFLGGGGYYGYALSGHAKGNTAADYGNGVINNNQDADIAFGKDSYYKRSDFGLNAVAGIQLKNRLSFSINYDFGLTSVINSTLATTDKNRVLGLAIGFELQ